MVKTLKSPVIFSTIICVILLYSGIIQINSKHSFHSLAPENDIVEISGKLVSSPVRIGNKNFYSSTINTNSVKTDTLFSTSTGYFSIYIPSTQIEAMFPGKLYSKSSNKRDYIFEEGGFYTFRGKVFNKIFYVDKCIENRWNDNLFGKIQYIRAKGRLYFKKLMYLWKEAGGLLLALICGSKEYTEESVVLNFRKAGLSHILALSGMHLSILSGIAVFIGNKTKRLRFSYGIRIAAIIIFVWFAGFSPSLLRAFICSCIMIFLSLINNKKTDYIYVLCISFILQTLISAESIKQAGFILSYGALTGILCLSNIINSLLTGFIPAKLSNPLSASVGAQIATAPVSIIFFKAIYPVGIIASVIVSPLVTLFIYTGIILIIISLICPFLAEVSGIFMNLLYTVIKFIVHIFSF